MIEMVNKKAWLDYVYYSLGNQWTNFKVAGLRKIDNNLTISTKHYDYLTKVALLNPYDSHLLGWINQRTILINELVIDSEELSNIDFIKDRIKRLGIPLNQTHFYFTGSKGYHIHIFFNGILEQEYKQKMIKCFKTDSMKAFDNTLIALENCPHWKSGKIKQEVKEWFKQKNLVMT